MKTIVWTGLFLFAVGCGSPKSKDPKTDSGRQAETPSSGIECLLPSLSGKKNSEIAREYVRLAVECPHLGEGVTEAIRE